MKLKISHLFHWLYAFLMFLPILFFLPSCIYYGFNEHAVNTETTDVTYVYESNEVNSDGDLVEYNIYNFNILNKSSQDLFVDEDGYIAFKLLTTLQMDDHYFIFEEGLNYLQNIEPNVYLVLEYSGNISIYFDEQSYNDGDNFTTINYYGNFENNCIIQYLDNDFIDYNFLSYTDYNEIDEVIVNNQNTIPQQINRAWSSVWELPIFSWTHNSFVTEPFSFVTGLFGVASNSTLNYILTYFLSVSIIWLVFDLLMYVPSFIHRWLDKGAIM